MGSGYDRLNKVLGEGLLAVDTYTDSLNKFIDALEEKSKAENYRGVFQNLKSQKQSMLIALLIIKDIKRRKLALLKEFSSAENQNMSSYTAAQREQAKVKEYEPQSRIQNQFVKINLVLHLKTVYGDDITKHLCLKLRSIDYFYLKNHNKSLNLKINLNKYYGKRDGGKIINLKINFKNTPR